MNSALTITRYVVVRNGETLSRSLGTYSEAIAVSREIPGSDIERREVAVEAPAKWGMFSSAGNRAIRGYAESLVKQAAKIQADGALSVAQRAKKLTNALVTFIAKWERLTRSDKHAEAGDTAVRECVGDFHDRVYEAVLGAYAPMCARAAWDLHRDLAWARVSKR